MQSIINKHRVGFLHVSFWCVYLSFSLYQISQFRHGRDIDWGKALTFTSIQFLFNIVIAYFNYFVTLPRFLARKNIWRYLLEFLVPFTLWITLRVHLQRYLADGYTYQEH